jgi:hypothetical protein
MEETINTYILLLHAFSCTNNKCDPLCHSLRNIIQHIKEDHSYPENYKNNNICNTKYCNSMRNFILHIHKCLNSNHPCKICQQISKEREIIEEACIILVNMKYHKNQ